MRRSGNDRTSPATRERERDSAVGRRQTRITHRSTPEGCIRAPQGPPPSDLIHGSRSTDRTAFPECNLRATTQPIRKMPESAGESEPFSADSPVFSPPRSVGPDGLGGLRAARFAGKECRAGGQPGGAVRGGESRRQPGQSARTHSSRPTNDCSRSSPQRCGEAAPGHMSEKFREGVEAEAVPGVDTLFLLADHLRHRLRAEDECGRDA